MALPLIIGAAAAGGALVWDSVQSFIAGDPPQTVNEVAEGASVTNVDGVNIEAGGLVAVVALGAAAIGAWYLLRN